jgi:hypothetical protein
MKGQERKSRLTAGLFSSTTDEWATPQDFFKELDREFHFTLDPCANEDNHKCKTYFTKEQDGLLQDWGGANCVLQPTLRQSHRCMGTQVLRREPKAQHQGGDADTGENGHLLLPRLHLPPSRTTFHSWTLEVRRSKARGTLPVNGRGIQITTN